ncbi:SPOSA6832_05021, partial [Sporobolomyces salmonicolor]
MSLLHALVARDAVVLAEHDVKAGQYSSVTQTLLSKIPPNDSKLTYAGSPRKVPTDGFECAEQYEENPPQDAIKAAQAELAATKDVMVKSIDAVLSRGERIEILVDRTDEMSHQARAFRKRSTVLRRKMWWKNVKLLLYFLVASACGIGLDHCRS